MDIYYGRPLITYMKWNQTEVVRFLLGPAGQAKTQRNAFIDLIKEKKVLEFHKKSFVNRFKIVKLKYFNRSYKF